LGKEPLHKLEKGEALISTRPALAKEDRKNYRAGKRNRGPLGGKKKYYGAVLQTVIPANLIVRRCHYERKKPRVDDRIPAYDKGPSVLISG